jgi:hypothetical protein
MNPSRRALIAGMAASSLLPATHAWAQAWPQRAHPNPAQALA